MRYLTLTAWNKNTVKFCRPAHKYTNNARWNSNK